MVCDEPAAMVVWVRVNPMPSRRSRYRALLHTPGFSR